ncbi:hypothetical protein ACJU26_15020 [Acidithiobacillus sp. M4-SHS-6]|uniref:hypothetical protein n=1 Tax=Acidithiobacillus sp. M4-SHS-6 TaxID=3383024 RepID=UPI0039BE3EDB
MSCQILPAQAAVADQNIGGQREILTSGAAGFGRTWTCTPWPGHIHRRLIE